jgi:hypothetical protein
MQQIKLTNQMKLSPHGRRICDIVAKEAGGLDAFIKIWRSNFLDKNDCKFLPVGWRIEHKTERHFGELSQFTSPSEENADNKQTATQIKPSDK